MLFLWNTTGRHQEEGGFFSSLDSMIAAIGDSETLWQTVPTISCRQKRVLLSIGTGGQIPHLGAWIAIHTRFEALLPKIDHNLCCCLLNILLLLLLKPHNPLEIKSLWNSIYQDQLHPPKNISSIQVRIP